MSAQQRYEDVDEFLPATPGVEEGTYRVKYVRCVGSIKGDYGLSNKHEFAFADLEGETINYFTPLKMGKGSKQRAMAEAFLGRDMEDGEIIAPRDLRGKVAEAFIELNAKGYPAIKGLSKIRKPAQRATARPKPEADEDNPFEPDEQ